MRTGHIVANTHSDVVLGPRFDDILQLLWSNRLIGWHGVIPETHTGYLHTHEVNCQFERITTTFGRNLVGTFCNWFTGNGPIVLPQKRKDGKDTASTACEVSLKVARHQFDAFVNDGTTKVSGSCQTLSSSNDHTSTACQHVAPDIVKIWTSDAARTSYHNIIGRIDAIAAGAMRTKQIVPAITIDKVGGLTVDSNILRFIARTTCTGNWVEFDNADVSEISSITAPQASRGGVEQETCIDGIVVFESIGECHFNGFREAEIG